MVFCLVRSFENIRQIDMEEKHAKIRPDFTYRDFHCQGVQVNKWFRRDRI